MFLGSLDWTDDQREFTEDNENLLMFAKKRPWDVSWWESLCSWSERKSLITSLVDLNVSYCMLVWAAVDFQSCCISWLGECLSIFLKITWHWVNLTDGGMMFRPNLLTGRKTLLRVPETGISNHFECILKQYYRYSQLPRFLINQQPWNAKIFLKEHIWSRAVFCFSGEDF